MNFETALICARSVFPGGYFVYDKFVGRKCFFDGWTTSIGYEYHDYDFEILVADVVSRKRFGDMRRHDVVWDAVSGSWVDVSGISERKLFAILRSDYGWLSRHQKKYDLTKYEWGYDIQKKYGYR